MKAPRRKHLKRTTLHPSLLPFFLLLLLVPLVLSLGLTPETLALFTKSFIFTDTAATASFDVIISASDHFIWENGENTFEYHFLSPEDIKPLHFQITNNSEVDILCTPHINNDIYYLVYTSGAVCSEFVVFANTTAEFYVLIAPDGLDTHPQDAGLFVDITQFQE